MRGSLVQGWCVWASVQVPNPLLKDGKITEVPLPAKTEVKKRPAAAKPKPNPEKKPKSKSDDDDGEKTQQYEDERGDDEAGKAAAAADEDEEAEEEEEQEEETTEPVVIFTPQIRQTGRAVEMKLAANRKEKVQVIQVSVILLVLPWASGGRSGDGLAAPCLAHLTPPHPQHSMRMIVFPHAPSQLPMPASPHPRARGPGKKHK